MQVETDRIWKVGGRQHVQVELSARIPLEYEEITTQGRRRQTRLFVWFDVSAQRTQFEGFGPTLPLVREIETPRSQHRTSVMRLDFSVAFTAEIAQLLLERARPTEPQVALRFQFRGVFRTRRHEEWGLTGDDGPMGMFWTAPEEPSWVMRATGESVYLDVVDDLTFELEPPPSNPRLELHVLAAPERPADPVKLRWSVEADAGHGRIDLQRARGSTWSTVATLDASGQFESEPTQPYRAAPPHGEFEAGLGTHADAGGRFRLRLTAEGTDSAESEPFDVQVAAIELGNEPRTSDETFSVHWLLQPYPASGANIELEREGGGQWARVGVLTRAGDFEAEPDPARRFVTPGAMGVESRIRLGELGRPGGRLRLTLHAQSPEVHRSTAPFSVEPEST